MRLDEIANGIVDETFKGIPGGTGPIRLADVGKQGWNLLAEDMPLPVCVLKADAVGRNETLMRATWPKPRRRPSLS